MFRLSEHQSHVLNGTFLISEVRGEYPLEINPRRKTPKLSPVTPKMNPPVDVHTPEMKRPSVS